MSEEKKKEQKAEVKEETPEEQKNISVEQIIGSYPIDRERVRDTLLVSISTNLNRVANALEYFASKDVTSEKAKAVTKP